MSAYDIYPLNTTHIRAQSLISLERQLRAEVVTFRTKTNIPCTSYTFHYVAIKLWSRLNVGKQ